jgi:hypothetical protein
MKSGGALRAALADIHPEALFADGFDGAIIGMCHRACRPAVVAYSRMTCIEILRMGGMGFEEAEEFFEFNVAGAWMGEQTPVFINLVEAR